MLKNVILKMLFVLDVFSAIYIAILAYFAGVNAPKHTLLTSAPNAIILRFWIGFIVSKLDVNLSMNDFFTARTLCELLICYFIEDIYGYAFHRYAHHNKYVYMNVHKVHHDNQAICFTTAFYVHPAELVGFYFVGVMAGPVILSFVMPGGIGRASLISWLCLAEFYLLWSHTGFESEPNSFVGALLPSTKFHSDHHRFYNCNFSSAHLDRVMGTLRS